MKASFIQCGLALIGLALCFSGAYELAALFVVGSFVIWALDKDESA
jgi:hypothetical protein